MFGSGYVIEHCIAAINALRKEELYRSYIADCAYCLVNGIFGKNTISKRYCDMVDNKPEEPEEDKSPEELVRERLAKYGIKVVSDYGCICPDGDAGP